MPELPEVETIVRALRDGGRGGNSLLGRKVDQAELRWVRSLAEPGVEEFLQRLPGQSVASLSRRAKFIQIGLDADTLLVHLRMSGDLRVEPDDPAHDLSHDRMLLHFTDGTRLVFNDPRKFGRVWLVSDPARVFAGLGPEPLDPSFTPELLYERLHASRRQVKPLLLDQSFLAGMGNIYTDEALHLAKIHPLSSSQRISAESAARLWQSIRSILDEGIRRNGASIDWVYRGGDFQNNFRVYQRTGQPCPVCGTPVERLVIGQRSTHFCPVCQLKEE